MEKIYILKKEKFISGPYSLEQLQENGLTDTDKVWYDGLVDWQPASLLVNEGVSLTLAVDTSSSKAAKTPFWKKLVSSKK